MVEDFSTDPQPLVSETINIKRTSEGGQNNQDQGNFLFLLFFLHGSSRSRLTSNKEAFEASKKTVIQNARNKQLFVFVTYTRTRYCLFSATLSPKISLYPTLFLGLQVFPSASSSTNFHVYSKGSTGPCPFAAIPPVPSCPPTGLQLCTLPGDFPTLWHTLPQLRKTGRPIWPAVPVQPRGAKDFRWNIIHLCPKCRMMPWLRK